jgi:hypothetical protein
MRHREVIVGLAVLALVVAGGWWARSPPLLAPEAPSPGSAPMASARQAESDDALPDVTLVDGSADAGEGVRITLSLTPQPPVAFAKMRVRVRAESGGDPVAIEGGRVSFEMTMPMGDHRYSLIPADQGWQTAEVVLPLCPSGKRRWNATVEGTVAGRPRTARFRLDLAPPR